MLKFLYRTFVFGFLAGFICDCSAAAQRNLPADDSLIAKALYDKLAPGHKLFLAKDDEPGKRLIIVGRLIRKEDVPIGGHRYSLYQTDDSGEYDLSTPGDESTARISGHVTTDEKGRFFISTILPGDYGTTPGNRQIHTTVPDSRPEAYEFYFSQHMSSGLSSWATGSGVITESGV